MHIPTRHAWAPPGVFLPARPGSAPDFLVERMPHISREAWTARLRSQSVLNAEGPTVLLTQPYTPHTRLFYYRHIEDEGIRSTDHHSINFLVHLVKHHPEIFEAPGIWHSLKTISSPVEINIA